MFVKGFISLVQTRKNLFERPTNCIKIKSFCPHLSLYRCLNQNSPCLQSSSLLQHFVRQLLLIHVDEALDQTLQLLSALLRQPIASCEESPSCWTHSPSVWILQQANSLLAALRGGELFSQLLLQEAVVHIGGGVAAGAQQQDVVGVVVLHLCGKMPPVLMRHNVFPVGPE